MKREKNKCQQNAAGKEYRLMNEEGFDPAGGVFRNTWHKKGMSVTLGNSFWTSLVTDLAFSFTKRVYCFWGSFKRKIHININICMNAHISTVHDRCQLDPHTITHVLIRLHCFPQGYVSWCADSPRINIRASTGLQVRQNTSLDKALINTSVKVPMYERSIIFWTTTIWTL